MISETVIDARRLGKSYRSYPGAVSRLLAALLPRFRSRGTDHWVLRGIDLRVEGGETVGIIGRNGSGKSTLLKLLTGALRQSEGGASVKGRVLALLELGAGLNPDLTGRQNVLFSAQLHALDEGKIAARLNEIEAFAELGEYFDSPVRTYSSGTVVRLAFSTASLAGVPVACALTTDMSTSDSPPAARHRKKSDVRSQTFGPDSSLSRYVVGTGSVPFDIAGCTGKQSS